MVNSSNKSQFQKQLDQGQFGQSSLNRTNRHRKSSPTIFAQMHCDLLYISIVFRDIAPKENKYVHSKPRITSLSNVTDHQICQRGLDLGAHSSQIYSSTALIILTPSCAKQCTRFYLHVGKRRQRATIPTIPATAPILTRRLRLKVLHLCRGLWDNLTLSSLLCLSPNSGLGGCSSILGLAFISALSTFAVDCMSDDTEFAHGVQIPMGGGRSTSN